MLAHGPLGIGVIRAKRPLTRQLEAHIGRNLVDHGSSDGLGFEGERRKQQVIAHGINHPGNTLGTKMDLTQDILWKYVLTRESSSRETGLYVF